MEKYEYEFEYELSLNTESMEKYEYEFELSLNTRLRSLSFARQAEGMEEQKERYLSYSNSYSYFPIRAHPCNPW